jgi:hypothetical protein
MEAARADRENSDVIKGKFDQGTNAFAGNGGGEIRNPLTLRIQSDRVLQDVNVNVYLFVARLWKALIR